jgi:hypothetical protein
MSQRRRHAMRPCECGRAMKAVVFILLVLAGLKLGHHEYLYRSATRDAIVAAYKERAAEACRKDARSAFLGVTPQAWNAPASVQLMIGKSGLDVQFWQVDNKHWNARYRNPLLVLSTGSPKGSVYCEYDIVNAAATVIRM